MYTTDDGIELSEKYTIEGRGVFLETPPDQYALNTYGSVKKFLSAEEKEIINKFILRNFAFDYSDRRRKK
ncbi:MAG: hypothetical protein LCI00_13130 [Chloroflexi bacterium]|nr:hypothetical protein [Chloroflexota bacterium]